MSSTAPEPPAPSSPSVPRPLRVGIVGTGNISRAHVPGWIAAGAELHAHSLHGAEAFAAEHGARVHGDLDDLFTAVDLVDVCTPSEDHPWIVHRALDAGLDVVCEKPLALGADQARALVDHARRAGRMLFPAHVVRYFPQYAEARRAIEAGGIGDLAVLRFERSGSVPASPWFLDEARSGGIVMDQMIHDIDQAIWMAGEVTSVFARQLIALSDEHVRTAHVVLSHRGGAISHCRGLWGPPGTRFRFRFDLAGSRGRLTYDSAADTGIRLDEVATGGERAEDGFLPSTATIPDPYAAEILDAVRSRRTGEPARVTAADGAYAVEIARHALESLRTGESIPC